MFDRRRRQPSLPGLPFTRRRWQGGSRHETLIRVLRLMQRIEGRPYCPPLKELALYVGVTDRTIRRYLDAMSLAGLSVPPLATEYAEGYGPVGGGR